MGRQVVGGAVVGLLLSSLMGLSPPDEAVAPKPDPRVFKPDPVPAVNEQGKSVRTVTAEGFRVELDLSPLIVGVNAREQEDWRTDLTTIQPGDLITVAQDGVTLRVGNQTLAPLSKGQTLQVSKVSDVWIGTAVVVKGEKKSGWIHRTQAKRAGTEEVIEPTLAQAVNSKFVSAALMAQKAKQFDDGLYAAVELAAQKGAGKFAGKEKLLKALLDAVAQQPPTRGAAVLGSAVQLGGGTPEVPAELRTLMKSATDEFLADARRSKPLAFYTWSPQLTQIFQQDRMLQTKLKPDEGVKELAAALQGNEEAKATYAQYLQLTSKLTNPPVPQPASLETAAGDLQGTFSLFPPSVSHESRLVHLLFDNQPIPEGFDLMNELVARIQSGKIDLTPQANSGWYDRQTWSLEPLVRPEATPEAAHLHLNEKYRKLLIEMFKGVLALTRETHIKQLEQPAPAAAPFEPEPRKEIAINLALSGEPLVTHYVRRAEAYRFVQTILTETFGDEALRELHRQTLEGPVETSLADELQAMQNLFLGATVVTSRQLGMGEGDAKPEDKGVREAAAAAYLQWAATLASDRDLSRDSRMMVPVFYDVMRKKTKVWVFLGWTRRDVRFNVDVPPTYSVFDAEGKEVPKGEKVDVTFHGHSESLLYPVMAEVYVSEILNRDEFRRHCDAYKSRTAILANLK